MFALNLSRVCAVFDLFKNPWGAATGGQHAPSARFSAGAPPGDDFLALLGGQRLEMPLDPPSLVDVVNEEHHGRIVAIRIKNGMFFLVISGNKFIVC